MEKQGTVLRGPIIGDYPQDKFTPSEETELVAMRELNMQWGSSKGVPRFWTTKGKLD